VPIIIVSAKDTEPDKIVIDVGSIGYKMGQAPKKDLLTAETIVKTFGKQGMHLEKNNLKPSDSYEINGIKPVVYKVGKTKDDILIYIFRSFVERDDMLRKANKFNDSYSLEAIPYKAKNAYIVYMPSVLAR
jgi:hypothetical protein